MSVIKRYVHSMGRPNRYVEFDDSIDPLAAIASLPTLTTRQIAGSELWFDTSETLTAADFAFQAQAGNRGAFLYIPNAEGFGGTSAATLAAALATTCPDGKPFSVAFVQFARTSNISAATGQADGEAAVAYLKKLGVPPTVMWSQDLYPTTAAAAIGYCNTSYEAATNAGWSAPSTKMYAEPGYPLSASDRYSKLYVQGYWATAANDTQRFPQPRGCQIVQSWGSSKGEWFPRPGLVVDSDLVQLDWNGASPIVLCRAA